MTRTDAIWVTQFLGEELTAEENRLETAACEIIPCGLEKTVSYGSGTAAGPAAIISASHQLERLIGKDEACRHGLYTHPALDCSAPITQVLHNVQKHAKLFIVPPEQGWVLHQYHESDKNRVKNRQLHRLWKRNEAIFKNTVNF